MKKLLRSVIDVDGQIPQPSLLKNFIYLSQSNVSIADEEDREIWEYIKNYAVNYSAIPTSVSIRDYLDRNGDVSTIDRLEEIEAVSQTYENADYEHLVTQEVHEQKDQEMHVVLKTAAQILFDGLTIKKNRENVTYKGHRGAMNYVLEKADSMLTADGGAKTKSNIILDTDEARKEFNRVCTSNKQTWGIITGLRDIDQVCRGIKAGELWTHAAFTGELKCVAGNSLIFNHLTKKLERTKELHDRGELPVVTALKHEGIEPLLVEAQASHLVENGVRKVYTVKLRSGRELEITDNHPLWTSKKGGSWRDLKDVVEGDYVGVPSVMRVPESRDDFSDAEVKALGYLLGGGAISDCIQISATNADIRRDFTEVLNALGYEEGAADYVTPSYRELTPKDRAPFVRVSHSTGVGNSEIVCPLRRLLEELDLWGTDSGTKFVPGEMFGLPDPQIALLLGSLWSMEGFCYTGDHERLDRESLSNRNDITYVTESKELATGVQMLLTRLGIQSTVGPVDTTCGGKPYRIYLVRIVTTPSKRKFCDFIRVVGRKDRFEALKRRLGTVDDRIFPTDLIAHLDPMDRARSSTGSWRYAGQAQGSLTITGDDLRILSQLDPDLEKHLEGDVAWEQVESITLKGKEMTYDLSVPEHHSFVVNDVITHNTTLALNWAYRAAFLLQYNVYYLSLEMPVDQIRRIIYVAHSNHPKFKGQGWPKLTYRLVRDGEDEEGNPITEDQKEFYHHIINDIEENRGKSYGNFIVRSPDEEVTVSRLRQDMEITHKQTPLHMAILDHFALMKPEKSTRNYYTDLNSIVRDTKRLALSFNNGERIPILGLLQINRSGKLEAAKNDGIYKMQALADANEAERSSDVISTTFLDNDLRAANSVQFGCLKNRDNPHFLPFRANVDWDTRYLYNDFVSLGSDHAMLGVTNRDEMMKLVEDDIKAEQKGESGDS